MRWATGFLIFFLSTSAFAGTHGQLTLPLDVAARAGFQSQGWWGLQLATRNANVIALNESVNVWRNSDGTTQTFGWLGNGDVDAASIDAFCVGATDCEVSKVYDQAFNISTNALIGNDATQVPGYLVVAATTSNSGTCPDGTYTFTVSGGSGVAATLSGTVTGGVLGALTPVNIGSYYSPPAASNTVTGGPCSVQPVVALTLSQRAPLWTKNAINGHRVMTEQVNYNGGDPTFTNTNYVVSEWLNLPSGVSLNLQAVTVIGAAQLQTSSYDVNAAMLLSTFPANWTYAFSGGDTATPAFRGTVGTSSLIPALISPSAWSFQSNLTNTTANVGGASGVIPVAGANLGVTTGAIGAGLLGGGRYGQADFLHSAVFGATLDSTTLAAVRKAINSISDMNTTSTDLIVYVGDSIGYGLASIAGNNPAKMLAAKGVLSVNPQIANISIPGGQYVSGTYAFTANFSTNWSALYSASKNIYVILALGRNDMVNGASAATVFARAQAYVNLLTAQGANVYVIATTILPEVDVSIPQVAVFNNLIRANAMLPLNAGGLGAVAIIDWAGDPFWSGPNFATGLVQGGPHPNDNPGYTDMVSTAAPVLNSVLP